MPHEIRRYKKKVTQLSPAATITRTILLSFAFIIIIGTLLLNLPFASVNGHSTGLLDSFFTATSATCVTGLVVVDTGTHWTLFGQLVIMLLIQLGGLGIVTFATFFSVLFGKKVGLKGRLLAQESLNHFSFQGILGIIKSVIIITFAMEAAGAILLSVRFIPDYGLKGIYMGIFHSISAFCNAGFDIMGNFQSFTAYNNDPLVVYTMMSLIVFGGLGFIVWNDIYEYKKNKAFLLHTKLVMLITAILIFFGAFIFLLFEFNNFDTMGNLDFFGKINSAFFQSITTRTAGFNTLNLDKMSETSKVVTILLMFIGGASGSTAGGIKVTTFGVIIIAIISQISGSNETVIFKRRVPGSIVNKALAIFGIGVIYIITLTILILSFESSKSFLDILYEVTSAFGIVGLSTAGTPGFTAVSKLLLVLTMFVGRVGPMSFAIALTLKTNKETGVVYPEGKIVVG